MRYYAQALFDGSWHFFAPPGITMTRDEAIDYLTKARRVGWRCRIRLCLDGMT